MNTKTNSPTPWDGLSPCDAYEVGYQHGGHDAGERVLSSQSARIAELEGALATLEAQVRDRVADTDDWVAGALIADCDAARALLGGGK